MLGTWTWGEAFAPHQGQHRASDIEFVATSALLPIWARAAAFFHYVA